MSKVSIITPIYIERAEQLGWLIEAIQSVQAQTYTNWEMVIIDDGSPLPIPMMSDGRIVWLKHDRRRGPGAARNTGIRASSASWILPLDYDDRLKPEALQVLYGARCEKGLIYGDLEYIGDRQGVLQIEDFNLDALRSLRGPMAVTSLFHKSAWKLVGGYNEGLTGLEDVEFAIRLAAQGICPKHIDALTFEYRKHGGSRHTDLEADGRQRLIAVQQEIQEKHRSTWSKIDMAHCDKCPGGAGPGPGVNVSVADGLGPDAVTIKYVGPKQGSFFQFGMSGQRYLVEGKGSWLKVRPDDLELFLMHTDGGQSDYLKPEPVPEAPPVPVFNVQHLPMPLAEDVPDITTLSQKDALALIKSSSDALDIRVWLSEEKASANVRDKVVQAAIARINELEDAA